MKFIRSFFWLVFVLIMHFNAYAEERIVIPRDNELTPQQMKDHGLLAQYCKNLNFTDCVEKVDRNINIQRGPALTIEGFPKAGYSIIWTGKILIPEDGKWTFIFDPLDDDIQLFVDGEKIINDNDRRSGPQKGTIRLTAGEHNIQVKYQDSGWVAQACVMKWQRGEGTGSQIEVVPIAAFRPSKDPYKEALRDFDSFLARNKQGIQSDLYKQLEGIYERLEMLYKLDR